MLLLTPDFLALHPGLAFTASSRPHEGPWPWPVWLQCTPTTSPPAAHSPVSPALQGGQRNSDGLRIPQCKEK